MKFALNQLARQISVSSEIVYKFEKLVNFLDSLDWEHKSSQQCRYSTNVKVTSGETEIVLYVEAKIKETEGGGYRDSAICLRPLRVSSKRRYFFSAPLECSIISPLVERLKEEYTWLKEPIEIKEDKIDYLIESIARFQNIYESL
jgi:hypothetical protein